jgi:hypothetical protein
MRGYFEISLKRWYVPMSLHGITTQKIIIFFFFFTAVRNSKSHSALFAFELAMYQLMRLLIKVVNMTVDSAVRDGKGDIHFKVLACHFLGGYTKNCKVKFLKYCINKPLKKQYEVHHL